MNGLAMYAATQKAASDDLVVRYAPLVKRIAYHLVARLPPTVQPDDLIQAGMIGLLEASRNYDATQGASFETYAGIRIRGSMLDEIRKNDWMPRSVHKKSRMLAEAVRKIEGATGRDARDHEVAAELGVSIDEYHQLLKDVHGQRVLSVEDLGLEGESIYDSTPSKTPGPLDGLQKADFNNRLTDAISGLPERERMVMTLYYEEELNLREIGSVLGVSESRVSQIHSQAVVRLQARLSKE